jgi:hypothetical protein
MGENLPFILTFIQTGGAISKSPMPRQRHIASRDRGEAPRVASPLRDYFARLAQKIISPVPMDFPAFSVLAAPAMVGVKAEFGLYSWPLLGSPPPTSHLRAHGVAAVSKLHCKPSSSGPKTPRTMDSRSLNIPRFTGHPSRKTTLGNVPDRGLETRRTLAGCGPKTPRNTGLPSVRKLLGLFRTQVRPSSKCYLPAPNKAIAGPKTLAPASSRSATRKSPLPMDLREGRFPNRPASRQWRVLDREIFEDEDEDEGRRRATSLSSFRRP